MKALALESFTTFGDLLRYLRQRERLTQRELGQAVGYGEAQINRLESGVRLPDVNLVMAQFIRALHLEDDSHAAARLVELATQRGEPPPSSVHLTYTHTTSAQQRFEFEAETNVASDSRCNNLPAYLTPFVGREHELARLTQLLADPACRLLTLVGPGGVGKTRLSIQAASTRADAFDDGVAFVALTGANSAKLIVPAIAAALNLILTDRGDPKAQLLNALRHGKVLLLLDNFEHLLDGATLATEILRGAPEVKLLVTSRERLNLQGEWVFDVAGLTVPDQHSHSDFDGFSAGVLFLQCVRRVLHDFAPDDLDEAAIVRICQLTQGMPLALELAAAWVRSLSCTEIANEIGRSLGFLSAKQRDFPSRHRSLQAVFDHSWRLLSTDEQRVFAQCSVFRSGFTREAALRVASATLPILTTLIDKSLIRHDKQNARYHIHEFARQFAGDKLDASEQAAQVRNRHLHFFAEMAELAEPEIREGEHARDYCTRLEIEHDNVRAALDWALTGGEFMPGLHMVGALWEFWMFRGHATEGRVQAERFLARTSADDSSLARAKALYTLGVLTFYIGNPRAALVALKECAVIARALGREGELILASALCGIGYNLFQLRAFADTQAQALEALALGQAIHNQWVCGHAHCQLAWVAQAHGDRQTARHHCLLSLACYQSCGCHPLHGAALRDVGILLYEDGEFASALDYLTQSLEIFRDFGDRTRVATSLFAIGDVATAQGRFTAAQAAYAEAAAIALDVGQPYLIERLSKSKAQVRPGDDHA